MANHSPSCLGEAMTCPSSQGCGLVVSPMSVSEVPRLTMTSPTSPSPMPTMLLGLSPVAGTTTQSLGRPKRDATYGLTGPSAWKEGTTLPSLCLRSGAVASSMSSLHCPVQSSSRFMPLASDTSRGANRPTSSVDKKDDTSEMRVVLA